MPQLPRHSTIVTVNLPSSVVSPGVNAELRTDVVGDVRLAHDLARQRLADLQVMPAHGPQVEHRVERRRFPNVRHFEVQKSGEEVNARIIEPSAAFTLHDKQQRDQRRTRSVSRILGEMRPHLLNDLGRKLSNLIGVPRPCRYNL